MFGLIPKISKTLRGTAILIVIQTSGCWFFFQKCSYLIVVVNHCLLHFYINIIFVVFIFTDKT